MKKKSYLTKMLVLAMFVGFAVSFVPLCHSFTDCCKNNDKNVDSIGADVELKSSPQTEKIFLVATRYLLARN
ncbi:MAG: hypothetical protein JXR27_07310 [Paludibacteraceae bacterium]|nr:hypothetical protein [Paludibacteraceae bacterium]